MNDWADTLAFGDRPTLTRGEVVGRYFVERFYRRAERVGAQVVARQLKKWGVPVDIAVLMICEPK